ncbi:MAG TPA: endonuclease/exonuclease/phosphatase family protein [Streptosporangiaceae bacterium]|nr:endonuclease/exonuclease/phosphatase family protein [Streptosporangiaceae bacterium]
MGAAMAAFRLLSYNVRSLLNGRPAVAQVIRACQPDAVCVQESPRGFRWRAGCAALARESGLRMIAGGWPAGLLILGGPRVTTVHAERFLLSLVPDRLQRGLTLAVLDVGGRRVTVADIHLDLNDGWRRRHAAEVLRHLDRVSVKYGTPAVVAGDVNEEPGSPAWQMLTGRLRDAYAVAPAGGELTFPARRPQVRIDAIFTGAGIGVAGCGVPEEPADSGMAAASDHLPVLASLELPG